MKAKIDQKFSSGFELTEESLLRLADTASQRLISGDAPIEIVAEVRRIDHALISYDRVSDCFGEENGKTDRLVAVTLKSKEDDGDQFSLAFEKDEPTRLVIRSDSRDRALLALSDIREYLKNEVVIRRFGWVDKVLSHRLAFPLIVLVSFIWLFYDLIQITGANRIKPPVDPSTEEKISYLYDSKIKVDGAILTKEFGYIELMTPFIIALIIMILGLFWRYIYLTDLFIWGKEKVRVEAKRSLLSKVFWVIGVGLLVTTVGGLALRTMG